MKQFVILSDVAYFVLLSRQTGFHLVSYIITVTQHCGLIENKWKQWLVISKHCIIRITDQELHSLIAMSAVYSYNNIFFHFSKYYVGVGSVEIFSLWRVLVSGGSLTGPRPGQCECCSALISTMFTFVLLLVSLLYLASPTAAQGSQSHHDMKPVFTPSCSAIYLYYPPV